MMRRKRKNCEVKFGTFWSNSVAWISLALSKFTAFLKSSARAEPVTDYAIGSSNYSC